MLHVWIKQQILTLYLEVTLR